MKLSMFPFNILKNPFNAHHELLHMVSLSFLPFLAPLLGGLGTAATGVLGGLGSAAGAIGSGLGAGLGSLGGGLGGLLGKLGSAGGGLLGKLPSLLKSGYGGLDKVLGGALPGGVPIGEGGLGKLFGKISGGPKDPFAWGQGAGEGFDANGLPISGIQQAGGGGGLFGKMGGVIERGKNVADVVGKVSDARNKVRDFLQPDYPNFDAMNLPELGMGGYGGPQPIQAWGPEQQFGRFEQVSGPSGFNRNIDG
jgi:hypothetical protein